MVHGWNLDGEMVMELKGAGSCVFSMDAHPSQNSIVTGGHDFIIKQWNLDTQEITHSFEDPSGRVLTPSSSSLNSLDFS